MAFVGGGWARCTKKTIISGGGWEMLRLFFEVMIEISVMLVKGKMKMGDEYGEDEFMEKRVVSYVVGDGRVSLAFDAAVCIMCLNEEVLVWSNYSGFGKNVIKVLKF